MGLGSTALFVAPLVYNTRRSGVFKFGGRRFILRRVAFPTDPAPEWFVVDLLENAESAGVSRSEVLAALGRAMVGRRFDLERLREMAGEFGTKRTQSEIETALAL